MKTVFVVYCKVLADTVPENYVVSIHKTKKGALQKKADCDSLPEETHFQIPHEYYIQEEDLLD